MQQAAAAPTALDLERLAHVADQDAVERAMESAEAGTAGRLPECGFEQVAVQPELIALVQNSVAEKAGLEQCFGIGIGGLEGREERLALKVVVAKEDADRARELLAQRPHRN